MKRVARSSGASARMMHASSSRGCILHFRSNGVLDAEVCASSNSEGLRQIDGFDFALQMPDNTRLKPEKLSAERELGYIDLLPDDPVRGLVFFQTPKGEKPKAVIFTREVFDNVHVVKWTV